ncbi:phosphate propanoyltransferase [Candidatus Falkowbacteria bacterium]|nr:phosphate propanoyltransferase [Candidatus Falkowbacteria bacterium]
MPKVKVEISARHAHLTQQDLEKLFGDGFKLERDRYLSQPGQFVSKSNVILVGLKRNLENVRVIGPCRNETQVEISKTDCFYLGIKAPVRLSGKTIGSGSVKIIGPKGEIEIKEGVIVAKRHLHINPEQAHKFSVSNGQKIKVAIDGPRALVFDEVEARVNEEFDAAVHLDTDEANAAGVEGEMKGELII